MQSLKLTDAPNRSLSIRTTTAPTTRTTCSRWSGSSARTARSHRAAGRRGRAAGARPLPLAVESVRPHRLRRDRPRCGRRPARGRDAGAPGAGGRAAADAAPGPRLADAALLARRRTRLPSAARTADAARRRLSRTPEDAPHHDGRAAVVPEFRRRGHPRTGGRRRSAVTPARPTALAGMTTLPSPVGSGRRRLAPPPPKNRFRSRERPLSRCPGPRGPAYGLPRGPAHLRRAAQTVGERGRTVPGRRDAEWNRAAAFPSWT